MDATASLIRFPGFTSTSGGRTVRTAHPDRAPAGQDADLVRLCRAGDRKAQRALYDRYRRLVFGVVLRMTGPNDAEEVAQEAFLRIFRGLGSFRGDAALATWIYRLAVNAALTHIARRPPPPADLDAASHVAADEVPGSDPMAARRLERAIAALPGGYRAVLVLHDVEGLSHEEIAAILECEVGTSKSQLHKARLRLRELLVGTRGGGQ